MISRQFHLGLLCVTVVLASGCLRTRSEASGNAPIVRRTAQATTTQQQQAQEVLEQQEYDSQLRELRGRIEVLEYKLQQAEQNKEQEGEQQTRIQEQLDERFKLYEEALAKMEQQVQALKDRAPGPASASKPSSGGQAQYAEAERAFDKKDWKNAILAYQKYRDNHPKGAEYGEATYKIGVSFQELGMKDEASAFYREVLEKFPNSRVAKKADYRLKNLK